MVRSFLLIVSFSTFIFSFAQQNIEVEIPWSGDFATITRFDESIKALALNHEYNDANLPTYIYRYFDKSFSTQDVELIVETIETSTASSFDQQFFKENNLVSPKELDYTYKIVSNRGKYYVGIELVPFVTENGVLKRVKKVSFRIVFKGVRPSNRNLKNFAASSVLGSGQWYKVRLSSSGIYKIDRAFLENLGVNVQGLNPNHIHVYGNATGMLPEANNQFRPDDLIKNAIQIVGDEDGSFDANDFILFYGVGPDEVRINPGVGFSVIKNLYDEFSYYYICINASEPPLRVANAFTSGATPNQTVMGVDQVVAYEKDEKNLIKSGKRWYGEEFDFTLEHTFNFALTGIQPTEEIKLFTSIAYKSSGGTNSLKVFLNNVQAQNYNFNVVGGNNFANRTFSTTNHLVNNANTSVKMVLERTNPSASAWLDKIEINYRRALNFTGTQVMLRDLRTVGIGNVSSFTLIGASSATTIWEVTEPTLPGRVNGDLNGGNLSFVVETDSLRQFIAFTHASAFVPSAVGRVTNQNLHALDFADYLIVTHPNFLSQANRLADLHREDGMTVHVVTTNQVYNEFSAGKMDPVAIRYFAKMFYDRANGNEVDMPKYLCLFGDGTYDPKNRLPNNNNLVVTYQSDNSENVVSSLTSDDFFGLLDENEGFAGSDGVDIGIGRIIATTSAHARTLVDKIEHYKRDGSSLFSNNAANQSKFGDWRLWITHIADDEDGGQFVIDHEGYVANYSSKHPVLNYEKIYLDAFTQVTTAGGQRYPDVPPLINSRIERGTLVMNYVGHGSETGLALERIIVIPQIMDWRNINRLPLFVSATCEFTRFDDPERQSAGEIMYLSREGGAISLMTTTRPVYINVNSVVGSTFYDYVFERDVQGRPLAMGEVLMETKNNSTSDQNRRSFMLLGDPALRLALPKLNVVVDSINGKSPDVVMDTLRSLSFVTIKAHVADENGNILNGFNGVATPSVFDKPQPTQTLGQDITSPVINFETQKNILYKGKSTVTNGRFEFSFVVPKDIDYSFGNGKISLYANSNSIDAAGVDNRVIIGGVNPNGLDDNEGPEVNLYMNDEKFVNGGLTNERPVFFAKLFDENGINAVGNGIGHDITAILDGKTNAPIILNDYYEAELDSYQKGMVRYQFENLEPGRHTLTFKVWDVNNNSSESELEFVVVKNEEVTIEHVLNYPNPFTTYTEFFFEHNQVDISLQVQIQIFTVTGKLVKTINELVMTNGFRSNGIPWDGRDDFGDQMGKGVYVYRLTVTAPDGSKADKLEKLVLLK